MASKILLAILFSFLLCGSLGSAQRSKRRFSERAQQCRLDRITARPPSQRIESEGGTTDVWEETAEEFQCAGAAAARNTIRPNSLSLPKYHSAPMMVFIERGEGVLGMNYPGCAETYEAQSAEQSSRRYNRRMGGRTHGERDEDLHQRVHRLRQGDMFVVPSGVVHWIYNDGGEDLVAVAFFDLNNEANQLDLRFRSFFLAGGLPRGGRHEEKGRSDDIRNIWTAFDQELIAEAFNIPSDIVRKMQQQTDDLIVRCDERMTFLTPEEQEEELSATSRRSSEPNGLEETICSSGIKHNMNTQFEADMYTREAGRINILSHRKLPILRFLGMSAEKGHLFPNAQYNLQWSMTDHRVVYVVAGEAEVQIADDFGNTVFNERVQRGTMLVIPQYYATAATAGGNGFEWITFKTSSQPMKTPAVGYTSAMSAFPLQLIEEIYQITTREAQQLKQTRWPHTFLLPPTRRSS